MARNERETADYGLSADLRISVIVPTFQHERFITQALDSIANLDNVSPQIIVIDDCSLDRTTSRIESWMREHPHADIRLIRNTRRQGLVRNLNTAFGYGRANYFAVLSGDDFFEAHSVANLITALDQSPPTSGIAYGDMRLVNESGVSIGSWSWGLPFRIDSTRHQVFTELLRFNWLPSVGTIFRKEVFHANGGYDSHLAFEDYDFWLRALRMWEVLYVPGVVTNYRVLESSMSRAPEFRGALIDSHIRALQKHAEGKSKDAEIARLGIWEKSVEYYSLPGIAKDDLREFHHVASAHISLKFAKYVSLKGQSGEFILRGILRSYRLLRKSWNFLRLGAIELRHWARRRLELSR